MIFTSGVHSQKYLDTADMGIQVLQLTKAGICFKVTHFHISCRYPDRLTDFQTFEAKEDVVLKTMVRIAKHNPFHKCSPHCVKHVRS